MVRKTAFAVAVVILLIAGSATTNLSGTVRTSPGIGAPPGISRRAPDLPGALGGVQRLLDPLPQPPSEDAVPVPPPSSVPPETVKPSPAEAMPAGSASPVPAPAADSAADAGGAPFASVPAGIISGYGTGTVFHADAVQSGGSRLGDVEVAFSGATFTSSVLDRPVLNEMARVVAPALPGSTGFGRGSGLEIGLVQSASASNQVVIDDAEAQAPPSTAPVTRQVGPVSLDPVAFASLLRGQAQSDGLAACTVGPDLAFGLGYAADVDLLETESDTATPGFDSPIVATAGADPVRSVSQSVSRTRLVRAAAPDGASPGHLGVESETRQTIAPVTFFAGTSRQFTVEVAGEWVLRVTADGTSGSLSYGPEGVSPETAVVRVLDQAGAVLGQITTQQLLGPAGVDISVPGVAEIVIGEPPRAIGGGRNSPPTRSPGRVAAAVDIVRIRLLDGVDDHLADVRVGHLEAAAAIPEGGLPCPAIEIVKRADPVEVRPGEEFVWWTTVSNRGDCLLDGVSVVDTITVTPGVRYTVVSSEPNAETADSDGRLVWNDIGPIRQHQTKELKLRLRVEADSPGGHFSNEALATGICRLGGTDRGAGTAFPIVEARVVLDQPAVGIVSVPPVQVAGAGNPRPPQADSSAVTEAASSGGEAAGILARTGAGAGLLVGVSLLVLGAVLRLTGRRRAIP